MFEPEMVYTGTDDCVVSFMAAIVQSVPDHSQQTVQEAQKLGKKLAVSGGDKKSLSKCQGN